MLIIKCTSSQNHIVKLIKVKKSCNPSLNTQSCKRGLLAVRDFCFGPFGTEKNIWADDEQLLSAVFSCFQGQKNQYDLITLTLDLERAHVD